MEVHKFGGTSVSSEEGLRTLEASAASGHVIVVSALAGVTDALEDFVRRAAEGSADPTPILERHREFIAEHLEQRHEEVESFLKDMESLLHSVVTVLEQLGRPEERLRDLVLSLGERASARIVAAYLRELGIKAVAYDAWDVGLVTTDDPGNADIIRWDGTRSRLLRDLRSGRVPVITGFIGRSDRGHVTTLGRGGSDYTATVLAGVLGSRSVIWTDVDGIMTADPELVDAEVVERLSYEEAVMAGASGAEVIHPKAVEAAKNLGVTVLIGNSFTGEIGTVISDSTEPGPKVVASRDDVALIRVSGAKMVDEPGVVGRVTSALGNAGVNLLAVFTTVSEPYINLLVEETNLKSAGEALNGLDYDWEVDKDVGLVTVIGEGMSARDVSEFLAACEEFDLLGSAHGVVAVSVVVPESEIREVTRRLAERLLV
ncbi:aspartate kinase [Methanopyrus sp.]